MRKKTQLLLMFLILIVLCGVYVFLKGKPQESQSSTTDESKIEVIKIDKEKVAKVAVKSNKGNIVYIKSGDKWTVEGAKFPVVQDSVSNIVNMVTDITAQRSLTAANDDLSQFGLKTPAIEVTVSINGGGDQVIEIGNKTPSASAYYLMVKGSSTIYISTLEAADSLNYSAEDLRDKKVSSVDAQSLSYLKINRNNQVIEFKEDENSSATLVQYWMYQYYKYPVGVNSENFNNLTQSLSQIQAEQFVDDNAKDLSKYGLDKPTLTITAIDKNKNSVDILVGKDKDADNIYFRTASSSAVYTVSRKVIEPFVNLKAFDLYDKFIYVTNIDNVDKIDLKSASSDYNFEISRQTKKAEKEGEQDETVTSYKLNGKDVAQEDFTGFYTSLIGLTADSESQKDINKNAEVTLTYYLNKGENKTVEIAFTPYSGDMYTVHVNGQSSFLISKTKISKIMGDVSALLK